MKSQDSDRYALVEYDVFSPAAETLVPEASRTSYATFRGGSPKEYRERYQGLAFKYDLSPGQLNENGEEGKFVVVKGEMTEHGNGVLFKNASVTILSGVSGPIKAPLSSEHLDDQFVRSEKPDLAKGSAHRFRLTFGPADGSADPESLYFTQATGNRRTKYLSPPDPGLPGYSAKIKDDQYEHWTSMSFPTGRDGNSTNSIFVPVEPNGSHPASSVAPVAG